MTDNDRLSRGAMLKALAVVPAAALALGAMTHESEAATKSSQSSVQYQNKPKNGAKCSQCRFFQANKKKPTANGGCQIVAGAISPNGWCVAYAKK